MSDDDLSFEGIQRRREFTRGVLPSIPVADRFRAMMGERVVPVENPAAGSVWPSIYADTAADSENQKVCACCGAVIQSKPEGAAWVRRPRLPYWCWCGDCAAKHRNSEEGMDGRNARQLNGRIG